MAIGDGLATSDWRKVSNATLVKCDVSLGQESAISAGIADLKDPNVSS